MIDKAAIKQGLNALSKVDKEIAKAYKSIGPPEPRIRENSFASFLSIIVGQQISTKAAAAIMGRVSNTLPSLSAASVLDIDKQLLRDAGLSWRKIEYAKGLALAVTTGELALDKFDTMSDQEVIKCITRLRGFGPWSAEIHLMFSLHRPDIFPADDLALLNALAHLKNLKERPTPKKARILVEHWSPYKSIGSLFLWHYYHQL